MTDFKDSLDNIRQRLILQRINNEIQYLDENPLQKTEERYNYLLEMKTKYNIIEQDKTNSQELVSTSPIDKIIKKQASKQYIYTSLHTPDEIITSTKDLDDFIDSLSNKE